MNLPTPGDYHIIISVGSIGGDSLAPYTVSVTTFCDNLCVAPGMTPPPCTLCGDAILDEKEECDNGNKAGCLNCFV